MRAMGLFLMMTAVSAGALNPETQTWIDERVSQGHWTGLSVAVLELDDAGEASVQYSHFGRLALDSDSPPDERTLYEIGSITKAFTGIALACAEGKGWLELDDPMSQHLPVNARIRDPSVAAITLRQLATHTSGLPRLPGNLVPSDPLDPYRDYDQAALLSYLAAWAPSQGLDKGYEYSNLGAGLLGYLIGRAGNADYQSALDRCVLNPLELTDTTLTPTEEQRQRLADPHMNGAKVKNWSRDILEGAGSLYSTPEDMAQFAKWILNPPEGDAGVAIRASIEPQVKVNQIGGAMGLGWHLRNTDTGDQPAIWHNGGTGGYASAMMVDPNIGRAVIVLANSTESVTPLAAMILEDKAPPELDPKLELSGEQLRDFLGWFELFDGFRIHVTSKGNQLLARATGQSALPLYPMGNDRFTYRDVEAEVSFHRDQSGKVISLILYQNGQRSAGRRIEPPGGLRHFERVALSPEMLAQYEGRYVLSESLVFEVKLHNGEITVQLSGQPPYKCYPYGEGRCFFEVADAQITFERNDNGAVTALILHQNGLDQRAERDPGADDTP